MPKQRKLISYAGKDSYGEAFGQRNVIPDGHGYHSERKRYLRERIEYMYFVEGMRQAEIARELNITESEVSVCRGQLLAEKRASEIKLHVPHISEPVARVKGGMVEVNTSPVKSAPDGPLMFLDTAEGQETLARVRQSYKAFVPSKWRNRQVVQLEDLRAYS